MKEKGKASKEARLRNTLLPFLLIVLLLSLAPGTVGCSGEEAPFDSDNIPVDLPEYVGYALARKDIAVIDLAEYKVVAFHRISGDGEGVGDFAIGPDGNLYFSINTVPGKFGKSTSGNSIRVMDPATGKVVDEIEVAYSPCRMSGLKWHFF